MITTLSSCFDETANDVSNRGKIKQKNISENKLKITRFEILSIKTGGIEIEEKDYDSQWLNNKKLKLEIKITFNKKVDLKNVKLNFKKMSGYPHMYVGIKENDIKTTPFIKDNTIIFKIEIDKINTSDTKNLSDFTKKYDNLKFFKFYEPIFYKNMNIYSSIIFYTIVRGHSAKTRKNSFIIHAKKYPTK